MAYRGWLQYGTMELANAERAVAYLDNLACSTSVQVMNDDSWPDTHTFLGQPAYTTPANDGAPWFAPSIPESADFLGIWPMEINGLDSTQLNREVLESAGQGAVFGIPHAKAREIKIEALLLASTPEGGEFGLQWLNGVLRGDACQEFDQPRTLQFLDVTPPISIDDTNEQVIANAQKHQRTLYNVACTDQVEVKQRFGQYLPERRQATCFKVEFTLTAGNPFIWKYQTALSDPVQLSLGTTTTVSFERTVNGVCPTACPPGDAPLYDPNLPTPTPLPRPLTPASAVGCQPIQSKRSRVTVPSAKVRQFEQVVPTVTIQTGAAAERNIRIQWVRGNDVGDLQCQSIGEVMVGYIPANSVMVLDGVTGQATCKTGSAATVDATPVVSGRLGGPWRAPVLRCGTDHTVVLDAATTVDANTRAVITGQVRAA